MPLKSTWKPYIARKCSLLTEMSSGFDHYEAHMFLLLWWHINDNTENGH